MMTRMPRSAASDPYAIMRFGVRWAETISTSCGMPNSSSAAAASAITVQSESDPMTTATSGAGAFSTGPDTQPCYGSAFEEPGRGARPRDHVIQFVADRR